MIYINGRFLTQKLTGVQRFAFEMVQEIIIANELETLILVPPAPIDSSFGNINWPIKIIGRNSGTLWEQVDLPLFLKKSGSPLLVNLVNTGPAFYKNQIVSILDMTTFINPAWFSKRFAYWYRLIVPLIAKNSIKIITISESSKKDIIRFLKTESSKIHVLYCGLTQKFSLKEAAHKQGSSIIINNVEVKPGCYILAVSSLDPRKNFKRLIEAYIISNQVIPLIIVGSKGKVFADDGIKTLIEGRDDIIFTGYVSDDELIQLYRSATCFIYPSLYEGFGMPPLEAMACNCPTIVSNTSSLPEVCGNASVYVDPHSTESIKKAIIEVVNDSILRAQLVALGKERIKKFSWKESSFKLKEIIKEISE